MSEIEQQFARAASDSRISLIEGNKGLYDGLDLDGSNSNAALAKLLGAPVVLVIDARGMTRGVAPLILGYQAFDPDIRIAGVILNNLGGSRHESKLRAVIEHYTDVEVIGAVQHDASLQIAERHLGLVPANEQDAARARIRHVGERVAAQVDLDRLLAIADSAPALNVPPPPEAAVPAERVRIGIAHDQAFGFYYSEDLDSLRAANVELVEHRHPACAGLAGRGRPHHRRRLSRNVHGANLKPMPRCGRRFAAPSKPGCRPTPNAAG